jgi:hypothetical protein
LKAVEMRSLDSCKNRLPVSLRNTTPTSNSIENKEFNLKYFAIRFSPGAGIPYTWCKTTWVTGLLPYYPPFGSVTLYGLAGRQSPRKKLMDGEKRNAPPVGTTN